mgnify:FL=1
MVRAGVLMTILSSSMFFAMTAPVVAFISSKASCDVVWNRTLRIGMQGDDIRRLQEFLTVIPVSGYYGFVTARAVREFQATHGITQAGVVGPQTRSALAMMYSCTSGVRPSEPLRISESAGTSTPRLLLTVVEQPVSSLAPKSALYVPFTKFSLTAEHADVEVRDVVVERTGPSVNNAFDYLSLLDEGGTELSYAYLRNTQRATFPGAFTVLAGNTKTLTIAGNMQADISAYDGQAAILQLISIQSSSPLFGNLPIRGTLQTFNSSISIGTAPMILSGYDPAAARTRVITDDDIRFSAVRVSAGSTEDIRLDGITWDQAGSASPTDISDVRVWVEGIAYATENAGRKYTASFEDGIKVTKGHAADIWITADILHGAANRTIKFDIRSSTDVWITGMSYGFGIAPYADGNTADTGESVFLTSDGTTDGNALTPFFSGSTVNVVSATVDYIGR